MRTNPTYASTSAEPSFFDLAVPAEEGAYRVYRYDRGAGAVRLLCTVSRADVPAKLGQFIPYDGNPLHHYHQRGRHGDAGDEAGAHAAAPAGRRRLDHPRPGAAARPRPDRQAGEDRQGAGGPAPGVGAGEKSFPPERVPISFLNEVSGFGARRQPPAAPGSPSRAPGGRHIEVRHRARAVTRVVDGETHLSDIQLGFEPGSFNVLLGRTRAGKTSLLRLHGGAGPPDLRHASASTAWTSRGVGRAAPQRRHGVPAVRQLPLAHRLREHRLAAAPGRRLPKPEHRPARARHRRPCSASSPARSAPRRS